MKKRYLSPFDRLFILFCRLLHYLIFTSYYINYTDRMMLCGLKRDCLR